MQAKINADLLFDLLARCALKDQSAFARLYQHSAARLNGVAFRILNNLELASEVLQDAFVQIWQRADEYRPDLADPMTWMIAIVRYRAYDRVRHEGRRINTHLQLDDAEVFETLSAPPSNLHCGLDPQLEQCLQLLERPQQQSILMAYYYGYSREELAEHFSTPINTIKSWLKRGLQRLQLCLET